MSQSACAGRERGGYAAFRVVDHRVDRRVADDVQVVLQLGSRHADLSTHHARAKESNDRAEVTFWSFSYSSMTCTAFIFSVCQRFPVSSEDHMASALADCRADLVQRDEFDLLRRKSLIRERPFNRVEVVSSNCHLA
eukprot:3746711-Rhodomonas_salina.2